MQKSGPPMWSIALAATALTLLVLRVFHPILDFEFIEYDVNDQVVNNPYIRGLSAENLEKIFTSRSLTSYYPVRTLTFAIDYRFWGLNPRGFKLTNLLIHLANTLLLFWLVLRLTGRPHGDNVPPQLPWYVVAAGFSAGLFAVHPVVVEPVTWVAGREELLMTLGALGCLHCHLSARQRSEAGGRTSAVWGYRAGSAFFCAAACLSNAVGAVIPMLVTAWDLLALDRPRFRKIVCGTWMLWAIGAATIAVKKLGPGGELVAGHAGALSAQRLMLVLDVFRRNLQTLLWPGDLAIVYADPPPQGFLDAGVMLGALAVCLSGAVLWMLRRHTIPLLGLVWFGLALAPSSQIIPHHWMRADRFLYLPLAGLAVTAAGVTLLAGPLRSRSAPGRAASAGMALAGVLLIFLLGRASAVQVDTWQSNVSLWEHCVRVSPRSAVAHGALADALTKSGEFRRAVPHYQAALEIDPDNRDTLNNFALELAANDDTRLRDYDLAIELARRGCELTEWKNQKLRRTLAMALNNYALELEGRGDFQRAVECYCEAAAADLDYEAPRFNLALLLATCSDETVRRPSEAVRVAKRACQIVQYRDANGLWILATAYSEAGRPDLAARALERATEVARASGNQELADRIQASLKLSGDRP